MLEWLRLTLTGNNDDPSFSGGGHGHCTLGVLIGVSRGVRQYCEMRLSVWVGPTTQVEKVSSATHRVRCESSNLKLSEELRIYYLTLVGGLLLQMTITCEKIGL